MEPIRVYRNRDGGDFGTTREGPDDEEFVVTTRADFDALAADAADARTLRAERDSLVKERDEARQEAERWRTARRESEDYIAAIVKATGDTWAGRIDFLAHIARLAAATARADKAEALVAAAANATSVHADLVALLREARPYLVNQGPFDERERSHLVRRIDAQLERKA